MLKLLAKNEKGRNFTKKRIITMVLVVVLVLSFSVNTFAWFEFGFDATEETDDVWESQVWAEGGQNGYYCHVYAQLNYLNSVWDEDHGEGFDYAYACTRICLYNPKFASAWGWKEFL